MSADPFVGPGESDPEPCPVCGAVGTVHACLPLCTACWLYHAGSECP